jgi:predicted acyltransferase
MSTAAPAKARIQSLDRFRGYTVVGMIFVNFVGGYAATHMLLKHHNTFFSYADTIMPQFFFAVGFAFRLTFGRRTATEGLGRAYWHAVRRIAGLALLAIVLERTARVASWQALVELGPWGLLREPVLHSWYGPLLHIALTSLWVLPVIRASATVRVTYMVASAVAQMAISHWFYFPWVHDHGTDGGPLGFLTWSIPTLVGTLACDWIVVADGRPRLIRMFFWSAILMGLGYALSCATTLYDVPEDEVASLAEQVYPSDAVIPTRERLAAGQLTWAEPPFVAPPDQQNRKHNYWMMSQRAATVSYHTFGAGFSLAVYALFYIACDIGGLGLGLFRTFGTNALVAFILHDLVGGAVGPFVPRDAPLWYLVAGFLTYFGIIYLFVRHLEKNGIYLKL